jgi:hypothetical protein
MSKIQEELKVQEVLEMVITMKLVNIYKEEQLLIIQEEEEDQEELEEDGMEEVYINHHHQGLNSAGGGGSGFVGFTDGTSPNKGTSGTLSENYTVTGISGYTDSTTRTNGSRTYTNSSTYRRTTAGAQYPPQYLDSDYISGVGEGNQESNGTGKGGNGLIVLKY